MNHDNLQFAYAAYCHRLRELFPRSPLLTFDDWLDDRDCTAARDRAERYLLAVGAETACLEWAAGYLAARSEE